MIRSGKGGGDGDGKGGGQLARLQTLAAQGPITRQQWDAMLTKRFQRMDTAGTGFITMDQMRAGRGGGAARSADDAMAPTPTPPKS